MRRVPRSHSEPAPPLATVGARIGWLLESKFGGNRSAMAQAIGFSHTIVSLVVGGARTPGPRLKAAIAARLRVRPGWLEDGTGEPFLPGGGTDAADATMPVSAVPLAGPVPTHLDPAAVGWAYVPGAARTPTRYWLRLTPDSPVVRVPGSGLLAGDRLLMETDPAEFPREGDLFDRLCVVRDPDAGGGVRPATLTHYGDAESEPARIEADFHDWADEDRSVVEDVYRRYPGGEIRHTRREVRTPGKRSRAGGRVVQPLVFPTVPYEAVVAVWLGVLHRP